MASIGVSSPPAVITAKGVDKLLSSINDDGTKLPAKSAALGIGNRLYGHSNIFVYEELKRILPRRQFQVKKHGNKTKLRDGSKIHFLTHMCGVKGLLKTGNRSTMEDRLISHYFVHVKQFEKDFEEFYDVELFDEAKEYEEKTRKEIRDALEENDDPSTWKSYGLNFLNNVFHALRCGLFPNCNEYETFYFGDKKFTTESVLQALSEVDTTVWERHLIPSSQSSLRQRSNTCGLRLFLILIVDDTFFRRLINETKGAPSREQSDFSTRGDDTEFWVDVCRAFKNQYYPLPAIPIPENYAGFYKDKETGELYDVTTCNSPWVTPGIVKRWYNDAQNKLTKFRTIYEKSGERNFSLENLDHFIENFTYGAQDAAFLAGLVLWRGDEALEGSGAEMQMIPGDDIVDGLGPSVADDQVSENRGGNNDDDDSTETTLSQGGPEDDAIDRLAKAITTNTQTSDCPERRKYYEAKMEETKSRSQYYEAMAEEMKQRNADGAAKRRLEFSEQLLQMANQNDVPAHLAQKMKKRAYSAIEEILSSSSEQNNMVSGATDNNNTNAGDETNGE